VLQYLTEVAPKKFQARPNAVLALQQFDVLLKYKAGVNNEAADCVSRIISFVNMEPVKE